MGDSGRIAASGDRAGALRAEPATQSQAEPLIPCAFKGLHISHIWEPYAHYDDHTGNKVAAYRRSDGAGYVIEDARSKRWWVTFAHPMACGRPGWHHHAFGSYPDKEAGAYAFDTVYELERLTGNTDRVTRADAQAIEARRAIDSEAGVVGDESAVTKCMSPNNATRGIVDVSLR